MSLRFAAAVFLCLAACTLFAQGRTGQGASARGGSQSASLSTNGAPKRNIFDIATSSDSGKTNTSVSPASSGRTTVSPFGTASPRTRSSSARRWKTNSKIADCIREKAVPANTNFSFSGTITGISTDGRYTVITMFDSISIKAENGADGDVPVTFTVVMDAEVAANASLKENTKKSFTVDSNYVYFVWNEVGCTVRVVDNSLTEPDSASSSSRR